MVGFKVIAVLVLIGLSTACGSDFGHEIHGNKLTVYFVESSDREAAEKIALYWKNNDLLTGKKQDIQLTRSKKILELRLIMNDPKGGIDLPFGERKVLMELQDTLGIVLNRNVEIMLCNSRFEKLINLNE